MEHTRGINESIEKIEKQIKAGNTEGSLGVMNLAEAREHLANISKKSKELTKQQKRDQAYNNTMIKRGEVVQRMQTFADELDKQRFEPMGRMLVTQGNLMEVLVEALIRKGYVTTEYLKEVQDDMIKAEKAKQEALTAQEPTVSVDVAKSDTDTTVVTEQHPHHKHHKEEKQHE